MTPKEYYSSRIVLYKETLQLLRKRSAMISFLRFLAFSAILLCVYLLVKQFSVITLAAIILLIFMFIVLIRISVSLRAKKDLTKELLFINTNETDILEGKENKFPAEALIKNMAMHTNDLDVFGNRSLFHLLNRTTTIFGNRMLAELLNDPMTTDKEIIKQQEAIRILSNQTDLRQLITAHGLTDKDTDGKIEQVLEWIQTEGLLIQKKWLNIIRYILPVLNTTAFIYYLETDNLIPVSLGVILSWILTASFIKYINSQHLLSGKKTMVLHQYASILQQFNRANPEESSLIGGLKHIAMEAHHEIFRLSKFMALLDQRLNLFVNLFLNSFFLYDIQCMTTLERWKNKNRDKFGTWTRSVGTIEALGSLSTFAFNNPGYCYPVPFTGEPGVSATQLGHPLIPHKKQVLNDITTGTGERLLLVTGSNMSGKSTFLRTIGVNLLLAQCGAPVCSATFTFSPMKILSSIRISDSLQDNTSYFMAELQRLREIIGQLETGFPALVLIDEVLRGTNSDDKTFGSETLIIKLIKYNCLALFASHDLSLSILESRYEKQISNYCFESTITNGELSFDYRLHKGVATNKNASFLMKKMGII